jgi:hypothetical protein
MDGEIKAVFINISFTQDGTVAPIHLEPGIIVFVIPPIGKS